MPGRFTASSDRDVAALADEALARIGRFGLGGSLDSGPTGSGVEVRSPITGRPYGRAPLGDGAVDGTAGDSAIDGSLDRAVEVFAVWRTVPAPRRAEVVRRLGELLRAHREDLATLVQIEAGKIRAEAVGEVQEMIDICDFAVGLGRQLYGLTIASERPGHRLTETWHPLGPAAVITAFNFPVAVWSWNAALAIVCGDPVIWKPSEASSLTALATNALAREACRLADAPVDLFQVVVGDATVGASLVADPRVPLVSATGSTRMGRAVAPVVATRFGRSILELGGNNAAIVAPSADAELAVRGIVFAAAGTAGQRCTTLRRLIVHRSRSAEIVERVSRAFDSLRVGNPLIDEPLVGPLIDLASWQRMERAVSTGIADGGSLLVGGQRVHADIAPDAAYVRPAVVSMPNQTAIVATETFAPILWVLEYDDFDEAVALQNGVPQGLASSIFTTDVREAERFTGPAGSDCGIANVNIGPSGAEIGGAFGGEKETGGGRESGSDSWKAYMRRSTATINFSDSLPLAQGVVFE